MLMMKTDDPEEAEETVTFSDVDNILIEVDIDENLYVLPKHHKCCSHTLSLIGVKDSCNVSANNITYKKKYESAISKCSSLWNKTNRSGSKANQQYRDIVGHSPKTPCVPNEVELIL